MFKAVVLLCACFLLVSGDEVKVRHDGYQLVRAHVQTEAQRALIEAAELDVWSPDSVAVIGDIDVLIPPGFGSVFQKAGIKYTVVIENVQELVDEQEAERLVNKLVQNADSDPFFNDYHDYEEIVFEVQRFAALNPGLVTYFPSIGKSIQGRDICAVWLHGDPGSHVNNSGRLSDIPAEVPKIFFNGGQHAREWISPATTMYIYYQLVTLFGVDPDVTAILDKIGFAIVPVVNPDGYDYAWTTNRMWRKNRRANSGGSFGVDLNRNWDDHWGGQGSSRVPSSDTYCGTAPFSEPETAAVSNWIKSLKNIKGAVDIHSYSQLILRPYGWTTALPPNDRVLLDLGAAMREIIRAEHGMLYTNQASWQLYYTTGTAQDWYYSKANITVSYTFELRDTGRYGFILPANQIIPTGEEIWAALLHFSKFVFNGLPLAKK